MPAYKVKLKSWPKDINTVVGESLNYSSFQMKEILKQNCWNATTNLQKNIVPNTEICFLPAISIS